LLLLDFDDFKDVNTRHGHPAGDRVLREVAAIVWGETRAIDIPARYGGDEFVVLLPQIGAQDATLVAERIRGKIEAWSTEVATGRITATVSVVVVAFPGCPADKPEDLVAEASAVLVSAKQSGRKNSVVQRSAYSHGLHPGGGSA
jgi:two-component system cell cycle response regulator